MAKKKHTYRRYRAVQLTKEEGLTQRQAAKELGTSLSTINREIKRYEFANAKSKTNLHLFSQIKDKTFTEFWDIIGPPAKRGQGQPIWDYEYDILNNLELHRHLFVVKSTGLGVTELFLRYLVYRCLRDNEWNGRQVAIVTGPNIDLATKLIKRIKKLFDKHEIFFEDRMQSLNLNGVEIQAYPSNNISSFRSLESPAFILLSEADFFGPSEQREVRYVTERYIGKSDPYIVLESTPNAPGGLFQTIEQEQDSIYHKMRLDYNVGLNKIYTEKEIERAKRSITFDREYNLHYLGHIGNSYHTEDILRSTNYTYDPDFVNPSSARVISCDPAYGSSNFGLCITDVRDGKICVLLAEEHKHSTSEEMLPYVYDLMQKYEPIDYVFVDGSQIDFIKGLKSMAGNEEVDYHAAIERYKKDKVDWTLCMIIQPFLFNTESKKRMLTHTRSTLEQGNLMIDKRFDILINALHNCSDSEGIIDKNFAGNDCLDSLMMCLQGYE